ncbi:MAG: hypothetical protein ACAI25_01345, partial [Planctomycetota bacterium]
AEDSSKCPSPAALAAFSEKGIDQAEPALLDHLARCGLCRSSLGPAKVAASSSPKAPDETIAAARRRVGMIRTHSDEQPIPPSRISSGRRLRTARAPAISVSPSGKGGLLAAAVILACAGLAFVAIAPSAPTSPEKSPAPPIKPQPKLVPTPQPTPPAQKPAPVAPHENPDSGNDVVAQLPAPQLPPVEEEPLEPEQVPGPEAQKPPTEQPAPAVNPDRSRPVPPVTAPAPGPTAPKTDPKTPGRPVSPPEPTVLACKVEEVSGPVEIRKKSEKTWRRLSVAELVHDGDGLRSKGEDGALTFSGKAKVTFTNDAAGTVTIKRTGICVALESGALDAESLAYDGLEVREANGFVTAWKGSRIHVQATESGLRVHVEKGTANAGNDLGRVTVHSAHEVTLQKDRRPGRPTPRR